MTFYAVIDTNVILSSILTANPLSPTIGIIEAVEENRLVPLYSDYLLDEYKIPICLHVCFQLLVSFLETGMTFFF